MVRFARTIGWLAVAGALASCSSGGGAAGAGGTGGAGQPTGGATGNGGGAGGEGGTAGGAGGGGAGTSGGQSVGTSGGSIVQAGVMLDVPADAVPAPTVITVAPTTAPSGYTLASQAYQFGPSGTVFTQPVAVTLPLSSAAAGVHVFWSNANGGFDDIGGTVNGSSITAMVTHFSVGFCAVPAGNGGSGGSSGTGGAAGASGAGGSGGAATSGSGGSAGGAAGSGSGGSGSGAGGSTSSGSGGSASGGTGGSLSSGSGGLGSGSGGAAGSSGAAGNAGSAGTAGSSGAAGNSGAAGAGPTDAGLGPDAAASLCKAAPLNLPGATVHYPEAGGAAPDASTYTGGTLVSGKMYLTSVTHYGGGTYVGVVREQLTIDTTAQTLVFGEYLPNTPGAQYKVMTYTVVSPNTLQVTVACNSASSPSGTFDMYYTVSGSQVTLTTAGSSDVLVY
ncbi:MAG TPA: hypothetical protein VKZ18_15125 [Polyangia bacterium]|nr:hypothetical protein [Polyangia bacterium]